ncbi:UNVERIFIED_ORG: 16S rRNA (cytosine967-C5)-methyltransferase [Xanthobacter viscosus]|uniref:RsmB/NOP family class I SAM-dependent RNA methyltransferase n=1 Tax=Xanthobacter autotrophicus TaxID=280 RepID=A0A6C1KJ81_XANAU|nr:RsmB/NOP family class I SAM-dependent RNA methyltransferase [Xanthobacter autotrophicus]TLX44255.1 RsmB/NOP family class I SAM-dependent RNA methyltransferase [Xanthobacter autotrophicus]
MIPAARISAAIEVLTDLTTRRRPAADALKDWGLSHRFAGSGDRAAIAGIVYDTLRRRASAAHVMGSEEPRALVLGMLVLMRALDGEAIAALADGSRFAPAPLTEDERARLADPSIKGAPPFVRGDYPQWLHASLRHVFGEDVVAEGAALATRAPLDLRVNTLKGEPEAVRAELSHLNPAPGRFSPLALRILLDSEGKAPPVSAEPAFLRGEVEVQDEGSQLAAILARPVPGSQVLDLCAGAGGKTLEFAALMDNKGQLYAHDSDIRRLKPMHERLARAGVRNVQVRSPRGAEDVLHDLEGHMDLVLVDAPCTGTGTWRRNPDAKWRVRPGALAQRTSEQAKILEEAAHYVRPGGRLAYVTCSLLDEENGAQVRALLSKREDFHVVPPNETVLSLGAQGAALADAALTSREGILMTPRRTGTDGFFVSVMKRAG